MVGRGRARLLGGARARLPALPPARETCGTRRCSRSGSPTITSSSAASARSPTAGSSARPASSKGSSPAPSTVGSMRSWDTWRIVEGDPPRARDALAIQARELGRRLEVVSLEMFALAVEGVALVNEGEVADGMRCLDEATVAALAGEYEEVVPAGWTCCFLLNACERVRDYERAAEWCGKVEEFGRRMRINFVTGACRAHYGAVLTWQGRWPEAERELTEATEDLSRRAAVLERRWRSCGSPTCAAGRAASPRRRSSSTEPRATRSPRWCSAEIALDLRRCLGGRDLLEPVLRRVPAQNRTLRAAPLEVMVRAKVATGEAEAATSHLVELRSIARRVGDTSAARLAEPLRKGSSRQPPATRRRRARGSRTRSSCSPPAARPSSWRGPGSSSREVLASLGREDAAVREATLALEASRRDRGVGRGGAGSRAAGRPRGAAGSRRLRRGDRLLTPRRARGASSGLGGTHGRRDRGAARAQQAHGSPPPAERLRQARLLLARRGGGGGEPAAPALEARRVAAWPP